MKQNMKKLALGVIILLVALFVLTGCSTTEEKQDDLAGLPVVNAEENEGFTTYTDKSGVSFAHPDNWISIGGDMVMFLSPDGSGTSVNMTSENVTSAISFSGYIEAAKVKVKAEMNVDGEIAQTEINLNGRKAYKLEYAASSQGVSMKVIQVVIRDGETMYILTVGSTTEGFEQQRATLDKIVASFKK